MKKIYRSLLVSLFAIFMLGTTSATTISGYMLYLNNPELPIPDVVISLKNLDIFKALSRSVCPSEEAE